MVDLGPCRFLFSRHYFPAVYGARPMNTRALPLSAVLFTLLFFTSCQKKETPASLQQSSASTSSARPFKDLRELPGTVFDVSYTPQTVRANESSWRSALKSVSSDGNVFVFDNPDAQISSLKEG